MNTDASGSGPASPSNRTAAEDAALQLLHEMAQIVREETGLKDPFAEHIAAAIVRGMRERLGGEDIYIPAPDKSAKYAAIRAKFRGNNIEEVCREFGVSERTV